MSDAHLSRQIDLGEGRSLAWAEAGEGAPIVLLHGALTSHEDWQVEPFGSLAALGRTLAVDRPGHGGSLRPRFEASPHAQARQIRAGMRRLGVARPLLVGHSMGGLVAMAYAADFPDEVAGLILVAPLAFPEVRPTEHVLFAPRAAPVLGPIASEMARLTDPGVLAVLQRAMFAPQPVPRAWRQRFRYRQILSREQMVLEGEDAAAILPGAPESGVEPNAIRCPVRILAGDRDLVASPQRHAGRLAELLPQARLTMFDGQGHMLHVCRPDAVVGAVERLMAEGEDDADAVLRRPAQG